MNRCKRGMVSLAIAGVLPIAGAFLYADVYLAPVVSPGADTVGGSIMNVGEAIIGQANDGRNVFAHMGVIPIYVASIPPTLADCTGNHIVDLGDYSIWQECLNGPEGVLGLGCACADLDGDSDVDLRDAAIHSRQY